MAGIVLSGLGEQSQGSEAFGDIIFIAREFHVPGALNWNVDSWMDRTSGHHVAGQEGLFSEGCSLTAPAPARLWVRAEMTRRPRPWAWEAYSLLRPIWSS